MGDRKQEGKAVACRESDSEREEKKLVGAVVQVQGGKSSFGVGRLVIRRGA